MVEQSNSPGWATYLRVSDEDKQTPERSFAMQRQRINEQLLNPSQVPFTREYTDILTGTNPNRKDYQQMLADAEAGKFSHLGLYRADRFGRNTVEGLQAATKLISINVKIRVANMPSLRPEEPDGFFMFLIQMGLAQREVDVLAQRTADGMEAKLRAGGWPHKAPEGYVNKEKLISSNKYERWIETDSEYNRYIREAWDLLLTDRYTLNEICEELTKRGYIRSSGRPWAWNDKKTGRRIAAENRLHDVFHSPLYTGWVVSERFGIKLGEVRGNWEPTVTTDEFHRGIEILRKHDLDKSRVKKHIYLLHGMLWIKVKDKRYKMFGSTPRGRSKYYSYYFAHAKPDGKKIFISCDDVDNQIPFWLKSIGVDPDLVNKIREVYKTQLQEITNDDYETKTDELMRRKSQLVEEESRLARLYITGKLEERSYDQLRNEWKEKLNNVENNLADMGRETKAHLDNLDMALALLTKIGDLYPRLKINQQTKLLQILTKRIIVNPNGEIIEYILNSPFAYLRYVVETFKDKNSILCGLEQLRYGVHVLHPTSTRGKMVL